MDDSKPLCWPLPTDEEARLEALRGFEMLDTPSEEPFDGIVEITAALLDVPTAALGFIDDDRLWLKAKVGTSLSQTSRAIAFCGHAILSTEAMVVEDLRADPRFADHPFVVDPPYARFYSGAPLVTHEGHCIGTLCVVDFRPRTLTREQTRNLERLASQAVEALEMRRLLLRLAETARPR